MDRFSVPANLSDTTSKLVALATLLTRSCDAVREAMGASKEDFALYQSGEKDPPQAEFTRLVGLILKKQGEAIERYRSSVHIRGQRGLPGR